jgi:hypothetical protein
VSLALIEGRKKRLTNEDESQKPLLPYNNLSRVIEQSLLCAHQLDGQSKPERKKRSRGGLMTIIEPREMLNSAASTINFASRDLLSELLRLPGARRRRRWRETAKNRARSRSLSMSMRSRRRKRNTFTCAGLCNWRSHSES